MLEKDFEDIICKYPELIEDDLKFAGRQINVFGKFIDILFEDKFGQKLIVELKRGTITRKHIGQVMEYEGSVLHEEDPTARIMLVGNRVPPNMQKALDHHGIEWKEISISELRKFLQGKKDNEFNTVLNVNGAIDQDLMKEQSPEAKKATSTTKGLNGYRNRENRKIGADSKGAEQVLMFLRNKGEAVTMDEIVEHMHAAGFKSKTFYDWSNGLVAAGLAGETTKDGKKAYIAIDLRVGEIDLEKYDFERKIYSAAKESNYKPLIRQYFSRKSKGNPIETTKQGFMNLLIGTNRGKFKSAKASGTIERFNQIKNGEDLNTTFTVVVYANEDVKEA